MRRSHLIEHWSSTQKAVTLSSVQAQQCGIANGQALGIQSVGRDFGLNMTLSMDADSAAAVGICKRAGKGRVRHLGAGNCGSKKVYGEDISIVQSQRCCKSRMRYEMAWTPMWQHCR